MSEKEIKLGLVIYGDGSARPNPGFVGSGFMAYTYDQNDDSGKHDKYGEYLTTNNGYQKKKKGASDKANGEINGKLVKPIEYFEGAVPSDRESTNNFAELKAILEGLRTCWDKEITRISIVCDSEYTLNVLRRDMSTWSRNGWMTSTGKPVSNKETIVALNDLVESIKACGVEIKLSWVRGHMDIAGNLQADYLSNIARDMSINKIYSPKVVSYSPKKYNDYQVEKHPFLTHKRIYFVTKPEQNIPGFYYQGDSGAGDFMIGKRLPETGYSVIILNTPDNTVEMMKQKQFEYAKGLTRISSLLLDRIFDKKVFRLIDNFGTHGCEADKRNTNVNFIDGKPLTMVMNPTGLSLRAIECFNTLSETLRLYMVNKEKIESEYLDTHRYHATDITAEFFDDEVKKVAGKEVPIKVLKKDFAVGIKNILLKHTIDYDGQSKEITIPIVFGTDVPDRNQIKRLEPLNPKIKLITWRYSEDSVNYAIIIESDDAVGIWSNFYADQIIIV